jgi:transcriptional regulator with XRE-family HTH domain
MNVIERIRLIRSQKQISQEYMASQLGLDTSSYHRLEKGICPLSVSRLERIAELLNVPLLELIQDPSENPKQGTDLESYIKHLEGEVRFLRSQLHEQIAKLYLQRDSNSNGPLSSRR